MTPSDADEGYAHDDDRAPPRRRARRDVLEIGRCDDRRSGGRGAEHARDLDDDDRDDGRRRIRGEDRRDDERDEGVRRDRDGRGRRSRSDDEDDRKDDRQGATKNDGDKPAEAKKTDDKAAAGKDSEESQNRRKSRRPLILTIVGVVVLLGLAYAVYYYFTHKGLVSTDDAYTDGYIVAVAPRVSGQVVSLDVVDNQFVHKGDPLIHIDPRPFAFDRDQAKGRVDSDQAQIANQRLGVEIAKKNFPAALQLAQANLLSAKANLQLSESNNRRQQNLPRQATTQQEVDTTSSSQQQAEAAVAQAQARVTQAEPVQQSIGQSQQQVDQLQGQAEQNKAQLGQAELNLEFTVVRAQQDGWVTRRNVDTGNYVTAGTQIMSLVTPDLWVTANYKETELNGMRPGQTVKISVDAYPDLDITGHVDSIQHGSGSRFSAFPAENATGNFVKIVQRVPVKIVIDSGLKTDEPLPLGVSVEPTVTVK
ncbi:MAG: HlyD family secretion protein [Janthinobacterium lividum]